MGDCGGKKRGMEKPQVEGINTGNHSLHLVLHLCFLNPLNYQLVTPQCTQRGIKKDKDRKKEQRNGGEKGLLQNFVL